MSRLRQEIRIISPVAWAIAIGVYAAMAVLMLLVPFQNDPNLRTWPAWGEALFVAGVGLPLFLLVLLVGYVNADARRRGMRYVMWTLLAALVPNAIGVVLYFVMRDPLMTPCLRCNRPVRSGYAFCPKCGAALAQACPQCRCAVESDWSHCAKCGATLGAV